MTHTVWLAANSLYYPDGGGYMWIFLNWALGLKSLGCNVVWLEAVQPETSPADLQKFIAQLKSRLADFGLAEQLALAPCSAEQRAGLESNSFIELSAIDSADLLIDISYGTSPEAIERCRRSALIDIDPGLLQIWLSEGNLELPPHDLYFTIGEQIGRPNNPTPTAGLEWHPTHPCVALDWWPVTSSTAAAPFTTVSHWSTSREWVVFGEEVYHNDKRAGFLPFLDLPQSTRQSLELALCLGHDEAEEANELRQRGWHINNGTEVAGTPQKFQQYVQASKGEFSCAKPSYVRMANAWLSDRTVCYLASGKPAIVQHTGVSEFLPDAAGLFRFRTVAEAANFLEQVSAEYDQQCRLARQLAEEHFDARRVIGRILERSIA